MPTARPDFATEMVGAQELHMEILDPTTRNVWQSLGPVTRAEYDAFPLEAVSVTGGERMSPAKSLYRHWVAGTLIASFVGCGGGDSTERTVRADEIPVAHTPPGCYGDVMPPPVLASCTEPLVEEAPDLRGMWRAVSIESDGMESPDHPALGSLQRIEQCGDRVVITGGGVVHDMRADGTEENGVNDVAEFDCATPITVVATFENGVHVLRPVGLPTEVTRRRDGDDLIWEYIGFTARLQLVGPPELDPEDL